jgi:hypothetical protein
MMAALDQVEGESVAVDVDATRVLTKIAEAVESETCILFLGAGVHAPPPEGSRFEYPEAARPPLGTALSELLAQKCELATRYPGEDQKNLQRVSHFFQIEEKRSGLVQALREAVHVGKKPSPVLRALAELNFARVITTNYDQLLETALHAAGKPPRVSIYKPKRGETTDDPPRPTSANPIVFKVHGDIDRPESIVVTDTDYITFLLRMSDKDPYDPIPLKLKADLTEWTTVFVGYSLLDYNLRVLFQALRWGEDPGNLPVMYSVDRSPDPLVVSVMGTSEESSLKFVVQDVWTFVPQLYELVTGRAMPDYRI